MGIENKCKFLSPQIKLEDFNGDWEAYNKYLYEIFVKDFIKSNNYFKNKKLTVRINPKICDYENAFIHLTSIENPNKKNDRITDLDRCSRLKWNKEIIDNYPCKFNCNNNCKKILYYENLYHNTYRMNLVFPDAKFKVVLEYREKYILLITGFYLKYDYRIKKELEKVERFNQQKTPID